MIAHDQLRALEFSDKAIRHRVDAGRLHPLWFNVYAVGRREVVREGRLMAAVLTCGDSACLSHESAAEHLGMWRPRSGPIHITVPYGRNPQRKGIKTHRRDLQPHEVTVHKGVPTTVPLIALLDLAPRLEPKALERAIGEADKTGLIDPETLREAVEAMPRRRGAGILKRILDRHTYVLTHTELERRFLDIVRRVGLPLPQGQRRHGRHRVDFIWPDLKLVVETDGLTYHRTAAQQSADLRRDHENLAAGLRTVRFSHAQIRYEPEYVEAVLTGLTAFP